MWPILLTLALLTSAAAGAGEQDDDAAALALSGAPVTAPAGVSPISLSIEGAQTFARVAGSEERIQRLSLDARFDEMFAPGWRGIVAERIDGSWAEGLASGQPANEAVGTLKEAYLSWQPQANLLVDAGRINARQGVALGYNPTDFFRADAVRSLISPDPNSLRDNRLGTVMLRGEELWDSGALTVSYAPRLTAHTSSAALDPDLGATNSQGRWMLSLSEQLAPGFTPQWLVFGRDGCSPQVGVNLTAGMGSATVAYVEVSGGRSTSLLGQALQLAGGETFRSRAAAGVTYSTTYKLSLTLEYEYNGAGSGQQQWSDLRAGDGPLYGRYREYALSQQDLATRSAGFIYASWQDLMFKHLDLSAFVREDLLDHSRMEWLEFRRHWNAVDVALRWQDVQGNTTSDLGASPQRQTWQLLLDYYL
jgi:hypothetical protein